MPTKQENLINAIATLVACLEAPETSENTIIDHAKGFANALKAMIPDIHVIVYPNAPGEPAAQEADGEQFVNNDAFKASGLSVLATSALWLDMQVTHTHIPQNFIRTGWVRLLKDNVVALNRLHDMLVNMHDNRIPAGYQAPSDLTGFWNYFTCQHRLDVLSSAHSSCKSANLRFLPDRLAFTYHLIVFGETLKYMPAFMTRQLERLLEQRGLQDALATLPELRDQAAHIAHVDNITDWWSFVMHGQLIDPMKSRIKRAQKAMSLILEKPEYLYDIAIHEKMKPESQARDAIDDRPGWLRHLLLAEHAVTAQTQKTQRAPAPVESYCQLPADDQSYASFPSIFDAPSTSPSTMQHVADMVYPKRLEGSVPGPIQLSVEDPPVNPHDTNALVQYTCHLFNEVRGKRRQHLATHRSDFVQIFIDAESMLIIMLQSFVDEILPDDNTPMVHKRLRNHFCHFANIHATDPAVTHFFESFSTTCILNAFALPALTP